MIHTTDEKAIAMAGPQNPWNVDEADFPVQGGCAEKLRYLINYAVLAPSSRNSQPWLWREQDGGLQLHADKERALTFSDPNEREMIISCGASLRFLSIAAHYFGYELEVQHFPNINDPYHVATIRLGKERARQTEDEALFHAIPKRHTNRGIFENRPVPQALMRRIEDDARSLGVWLRLVEAREDREMLVSLIAHGDLEQWDDPEFTAEMASWIRPSDAQSMDGMPVEVMCYNKLEEHALPLAMRHPLVGRLIGLDDIQADRDWLLAGGAPVLAVLGTPGTNDSSRDWLAIGEALGTILLRCASAGIMASFFNSPVQLQHLWPRVYGIIQHRGFLHLIFRLGYPLETRAHAPRRSVKDVLVS